MPEGPEVFVMTQRLAKRFLCGCSLSSIKALCDRYAGNVIPRKFKRALPLKITEIDCKGKKTFIKFEQDWALLISYGMSGHWETAPTACAQLEFVFTATTGLQYRYYWVSSRNLPTCSVRFMRWESLHQELDKLGYDIIQDDPEPTQIINAFGNSKKGVCAFLMDQYPFCGIGNYIKSVVLYRCCISPFRKVCELNDDEKWLIWAMAQRVATEAVAAKGMGIRDYKDETGKVVGVAFDITPYNKKQDRLGNNVESCVVAGRTTWWVPAVQV